MVELERAQTDLGRSLERAHPTFDEGTIRKWDTYGRPCTLGRWTELMEDRADESRIVGFTKFDGGRIAVSTVWWGLDLGFHIGSAPLMFETMIFGGKLDGRQFRYPSREAAERGHALACGYVERYALPKPVPVKRAHARRYGR